MEKKAPSPAEMRYSDYDICHLLKNGSREAVSLLVYRYYDDLLRYGCSFSSNTLMVEDVIQDLFCELFQRPQGFSNINFIKPYLFTSLRRRIFRQLQRDKKIHFVGHLAEVGFQFEVQFSHEDLLSREEQKEEQARTISAYIQKLSPRQREAIYLRFYENLSYDAISQIMNITVPYLYLLIHKSINRIRTMINENGKPASGKK